MGVSEGEVSDISLDEDYALESSIFIENEQTINDWLSFQYGLRYSLFHYLGEGRAYEYAEGAPGERREVLDFTDYDQNEVIEQYGNLEPRFAAKIQLNKLSSVKASYMRTAQYIHLISNTAASTPLDVWTPSTNNIKPQLADQVAVGYFRNFRNNSIQTSLEFYYKDMQNTVEYIDEADLLLNEFLEGDLLAGDGRAYGMELQVEKKKGKLSGWFSYTLARTERKIEGISNGEWFPTRFDQTHNFSTTAFYELNKKWTLSANFVLNSGTPVTFPTNRLNVQGYVIPYNADGSRNNTRLPVYHRLDISATLSGKQKEGKRWKGDWVFSVYNVYNRRNPFAIYFQQPEDRINAGEPVKTEAVQLSVVGNFIPAVSYNFEF